MTIIDGPLFKGRVDDSIDPIASKYWHGFDIRLIGKP
jgi:hypothetical protein